MGDFGDCLEPDKTYKPLSVAAQAKVVVFLIFCILLLFSLVGTLAALGIVFGYWKYLKKGGVKYLFIGYEIYKWITVLWLVVPTLLGIVAAVTYGGYLGEEIVVPAFFIAFNGLIAYLLGAYFFYDMLVAHKSWIDENGLFTDKEKSNEEPKKTLKISKPTSIPDEILKWNKLKEEGIITTEEFNEAKNKLLGRS